MLCAGEGSDESGAQACAVAACGKVVVVVVNLERRDGGELVVGRGQDDGGFR
jgi:hypothetical protein